jgi:nucleotide-binding universal stress UspA family protein
MAIRDILIHLDSTPRSAVRLGLATELAVRLRARLVGLYVTPGRASGPDELRGAALLEEEFRRWLGQQGIHGEWRLAQGSVSDALCRFGCCTDLSIIGQPGHREQKGGLSQREFLKVLRRVGGPVLAVPYAGSFTSVGERALVLWDSSPQTARAVNEALPLLCGAQAVKVLISESRLQRDVDVRIADSEILGHLGRHGISAKAGRLFMRKASEMGEEVLSYAADFQADLVVVGASSSSRWRHLIGRSFIHTLISAMTAPLLLAS